jgi:hypothetical protein
MLADVRFHLLRLLISSCVFSGSDGTETELADATAGLIAVLARAGTLEVE